MIPIDFIDNMQAQLGNELDAFCQALSEPPTVSIRVNDKLMPGELPVLINDSQARQVPWNPDGYYLSARPQFTLDPLMHAGCYYVQEPSSMFLDHVLRELVPDDAVVLDLCAAPGGKSTIISQHLLYGLLVSNEVVRQRVFILAENVQKWGNGNVVVTHNKPSDFSERMPNAFDCILVDAPCSGEGMFRKDERAQQEWSLRNVQMCAQRQKQILKDAWGALKPGGLIIYSTCTYNTLENEQIVRFINNELGADIVPIPLQQQWGIQQGLGCHFYPHKLRGEGLYMCALRKREQHFTEFRPKPAKKNKRQPQQDLQEVREWLFNPELWHLYQTERFVIAFPEDFRELIEYMYDHFTCISVGFGLSELRGRHQAPLHSLSMVKDFNAEAFPIVELELPQALAYLRTEALQLPHAPVGLVLLTYHNVPLGFAKNIGNHCNNLYPYEWRIRNASL